MKFYTENKIANEVDLKPGDVCAWFTAALRRDPKYIEADSCWPLERTLRMWLTDPDGLNATWTDEAAFDVLLTMALEARRELPPVRMARVVTFKGKPGLEAVKPYMPANYTATERGGLITIIGRDDAGWTLEDYVIPRLASGLITAEEIQP